MLEARISTRRPLPYLTGEAWFAGLPFYVDERVLMPRSPFAELIAHAFRAMAGSGRGPTYSRNRDRQRLHGDRLCAGVPGEQRGGHGYLGRALEVASRNVARHEVADRVQLVEADLYAGLAGPFDLIISNPPYVSPEEVASLPDEYRHEPQLALFPERTGWQRRPESCNMPRDS